MSKKLKVNKFYSDLDELLTSMVKILSNYGTSKILQQYFFDEFQSFVYGNLVLNFFSNLTQKNVEEANLPLGKIGIIKRQYRCVLREAKSATSPYLKHKTIDESYYNTFRSRLRKEFPKFIKIACEIEKIVDINRLKMYLRKKVRV